MTIGGLSMEDYWKKLRRWELMVEVVDPFKVQSNKIKVKDPFLAIEDEKKDDEPTQEELDAINTQMYKGMSMDEAAA